MSLTSIQFAANYAPEIQGIAKTIDTVSILWGRLPIHPSGGLVHKFGSLDSAGTVATRKIGGPMPKTEASTTSPREERLMICGKRCEADVKLVAINPAARAVEITRGTAQVAKYLDHEILQGDGTKDAEQLIGFRDRATGTRLIKAATDGAVLTLDMFHQMIDQVEDVGGGRIAIMNRTLCRKFKALVLASAGGATVQDVTSDIFRYEGVDVIPAKRNHLNAELLPFTEKCGNSTATSSAYCIAPGAPGSDFSGVGLVAVSNTIELLTEGTRDSQFIDIVEIAVGLAVYEPTSLSRLYGLKAA